MPQTKPTAHHDVLTFRHGLRTAIAAGLAYWLTQVFHLPQGYWAAISAIVVMQSVVGATVLACRDRAIGTAIGCIVGWLTAHIWHHSIFVFALAVLAVILFSTAVRLPNAGRLGAVAVAIIVLTPHLQPLSRIAFERFAEVSLGIAVSLAVAEGWTKLGSRISWMNP